MATIGAKLVAELLGVENVGGDSVCVTCIVNRTDVTPLLVNPEAQARAFIVSVCDTVIVEPLAIDVDVPPGVHPLVVDGVEPSTV